MSAQTQAEFDTQTLMPTMQRDVGEDDVGAVQISLTRVPGFETVTLAVEVTLDGENWLPAPAVGYLLAPTLTVDSSGTTAIYNGYTITPYVAWRVRYTGKTSATGRAMVTMASQRLQANLFVREGVTEQLIGTPTITVGMAAVLLRRNMEADAVSVQVSPLGTYTSGTLTLAPEITLDGQQWARPYLLIDRTLSTTPDLSYSGVSVIDSRYNVQCATAFRMRASGSPPTASAQVTIVSYRTPYGAAATAGAKGA